MAFPGTYNFNYYKGDTHEFRVYPKDSSGNPFALSGYAVDFTISNALGAAGVAGQIEGLATISTDGSYIQCVISPGQGSLLNAGTRYYYDVQISRSLPDYDRVYTLLAGTISVTEQVTGAA